MNSQQITYFLEVVRQGSFTKAAQVLYTSQPSLSRQIARLEDEFGAELFLPVKDRRCFITDREEILRFICRDGETSGGIVYGGEERSFAV